MDVFNCYHEDFVSDPRSRLKEILEFVGLAYDGQYIEACAGIVNEKPHQSREELNWPEDLMEEVETRALNYPFLKRYFQS
jgi:hypothetical protein